MQKMQLTGFNVTLGDPQLHAINPLQGKLVAIAIRDSGLSFYLLLSSKYLVHLSTTSNKRSTCETREFPSGEGGKFL